MKIRNILLSAVVLLCTSCMSEKTWSDLPIDKVYKTESDADAAAMGMYASMLNMSTYTLPTMLGNTTSSADTRFLYVVSGGIHTETSYLDEYWSSNYTVVRRANEVIEHIWSSPIEEEIKCKYVAEAMTLRAYAYFRILRFWGDVPFRLAEKDSWFSTFSVTPMAEIYKSIIADLEWSVNNIWSYGEKPRGRLDSEAAKMILADVYLTCAQSAGNYNSATSASALKPYHDAFIDLRPSYLKRVKELCAEVMASPNYALETKDWTKLWGYTATFDSRDNKEHIWTTQVVPGVLGSKTIFKLTPTYSEYCPAQAVGSLFMTWNWAASFDRNDVRFKDGIIWEYRDARYQPHTTGKYYVDVWRRDLDNESVVLKGNLKTEKDTIWRYNSYQRLQTKKFYDSTYKVTNNAIGPAIQMPYYRMAEAYLFYAEAENELNSCSADAVSKINAIRKRAGVPEYAEGQFSREEFRNKIIDEREWEFAMEGKDVFTIMRCGQLEERCANKEVAWDGVDGVEGNPRPRTADNYWLPYPSSERSTNIELRDMVRMDYKK